MKFKQKKISHGSQKKILQNNGEKYSGMLRV